MTDDQNITFLDRLGDQLEDAANRDLHGARRPVLQRPAVRIAGAAFAAAGVVATSGLLRPTVSIASVDVRTEDGYIVAEIEDLEADSDELRAAFLQHGLDITVTLEPVSPTFVGRVSFIETDGVDDRPLTNVEEWCQPYRPCSAIGLRIPLDYAGRASIVLGRPAAPDEAYVTSTDSFLRGEALHCSDLIGATAEEARAWMDARGLVPDWRRSEQERSVDHQATDEEVAGMFVHGAVALTPTTIVVWVAPVEPDPLPAEYVAVMNEGC